jgi:hypothetical protein
MAFLYLIKITSEFAISFLNSNVDSGSDAWLSPIYKQLSSQQTIEKPEMENLNSWTPFSFFLHARHVSNTVSVSTLPQLVICAVNFPPKHCNKIHVSSIIDPFIQHTRLYLNTHTHKKIYIKFSKAVLSILYSMAYSNSVNKFIKWQISFWTSTTIQRTSHEKTESHLPIMWLQNFLHVSFCVLFKNCHASLLRLLAFISCSFTVSRSQNYLRNTILQVNLHTLTINFSIIIFSHFFQCCYSP